MFAQSASNEPVIDAEILSETRNTRRKAAIALLNPPKVEAPPPYKFYHMRYYFKECEDDNNPTGIWHNGGATIVYQRFPNRLLYSISVCSRNDMFSRKQGRQIAIKRLRHGRYDEIPLTADSKFSNLINSTVGPSVYRRADQHHDWQRTFADEIAEGTVSADISHHLF